MKTITTTIDISAPASTVWAHLCDLDSYREWNPFITSASGSLAIGNRLAVTTRPPGGKAFTFKPTVTDVAANRDLRWLGRLMMPGIFDGEHAFRLEPLGADATRLVQSERFTGILTFLLKGVFAQTEQGFRVMNQALKQRCEAPAG